MIKQTYLALVVQRGIPLVQAEALWMEIETAYTEAGRYFHDLSHLEYLLNELQPIQPLIADWETLFFSLVYHDIVYDVEQNIVLHNNEQQSADFALRHLQQIQYPREKTEKCRLQILATQKHDRGNDPDTHFLIDADLSILGQPWPVYQQYKNKVRMEYHFYPDSIYQAGRRKVLETFLQRNPLYKTKHFHDLYETTAKENIKKELLLLQAR